MKTIFGLLTFSTSFATMAYAMIMASQMSDLTGEEIYSQCLVMGPYLLGLGLGSYLADKTPEIKTIFFLWGTEWASVILLPLVPTVLLSIIFLYLNFSPIGTSLESKQSIEIILSMASFFSLGIGILGGAQLPLIIRLSSKLIKPELVMAINYMGPLLAGPFIIICQSSGMPASGQIAITAIVQIIGLSLIIQILPKKTIALSLLAIPLILVNLVVKFYPKLEYITIKSSYIGTKMNNLSELPTTIRNIELFAELERVKTSYQVIDFFTTPAEVHLLTPSNSTLYLNRKTQFDLYAIDVYHHSMMESGLNLIKDLPEKILILGGGDGILINELRKRVPNAHIQMVELDEGIINWSKNNPLISKFNENIYERLDEKTLVTYNDAITFLRQHNQTKKYDLVFIDFPFPHGHELAKLYSYEFYRLVNRVTHPQSVIVIDLPIQHDPDGSLASDTRIILKTLKVSGFKKRLPFGPMTTFVVAKKDGADLEFNYEKFPADIPLAAKINLIRVISNDELNEVDQNTTTNSMFWPKGL